MPQCWFAFPRWFALALWAAGGLAASAHAAFRPEVLAQLEAAITNAVAEHRCPGAVVWLEHGGTTYQRAFGQRALKPAAEGMTLDTVFDVASLTKVLATTPAVMRLVEREQVRIDEPVQRYLPEFRGEGAAAITVRHLLTHTSGLRSGISGTSFQGYAGAIARAVEEKPNPAPGKDFRYSDINFILLGEIVQRVTRRPLDEFVAEEIYRPLQMRQTRYLPPRDWRPRIAPTQESLRGTVHDPTARRMGGVAGHAGVFSTAGDIARYARMMLNEGELEGVRIFQPATVRLMTSVQSPEGVRTRRGLGWDIDSPYSRPRGLVFPLGSFGHTGWTGTLLWIDPFSKTFLIFLSNRVHPDGKGNVLDLYAITGTLAARAVEGFDFQNVSGALPFRTNLINWGVATNYLPPPIAEAGAVLNGIDVLVKENFAPLRNLRVGLISNHTGIDRRRRSTIDLLHEAPGVQLKALFSPEHGLRGEADAAVTNSLDAKTGLPVFSLYPPIPKRATNQTRDEHQALVMKMRQPTREQLAGLDALVFDIQDIGCRFYTYIATLGTCLEAAAGAGVRFFVLDRVNPINGLTVEGPLYHGPPRFVAYHAVPLRHGMTVGELAQMFNSERGWKADLTVIRLQGWRREMWFDETGLPWRHPSPNMRSLRAAILYPGVGLHESAVSVGRGTDTPFEILGAPYIDDVQLASVLNGARLPGLRFVPLEFTPRYPKSPFDSNRCHGVSLLITDRDQVRPVEAGLELALTLRRLYGTNYALSQIEHLLAHPPTLEAIRSGQDRRHTVASWAKELAEFRERRQRFLLY